jgi:eukaryotic-like serine/threonine-protein kinase
MSQTSKSDSGAIKLDEVKLVHALTSRGLVTREEVEQCRAGAAGARALLERLVGGGSLTAAQARRALQEMPLLMKEQIPGYQMIEKLGQGAMGTVFKARQLNLDRMVAIKVLNPRLAADPGFLQRLKREALLAAKLSHNNIVQAIDFDQAGKIHYYVMEHVEGKTIKQELEGGKVYAEKEAVEIVLQIAQALDHAHRRGLIHRDIKPANIILTPEGIAKLADLGMARETADEALARKEKGLSIGTPYYMAPEQIEGVEDVDVRADVYSLGATFYHMVTGQVPFPGKTVDAVFEAHLGQELTPPDHLNTALSSGLGEVVEYMMARDRRQRYPTPEDLIVDLELLLTGSPPKFARQHLREASTLQALAEGDADEEEKPSRRKGSSRPRGVPVLWAAVLGGALVLSLLVNLVLLILRR